jgi:hypothetical protein
LTILLRSRGRPGILTLRSRVSSGAGTCRNRGVY